MIVTQFGIGESSRLVVTHLNTTKRRLAEEELQKLNEESAEKVKQRTAKIEQINFQLKEEIHQRMRYEKLLKDYQEKLQALNAEILKIEEHDKRRIVTELHENVGQILTLANLKLGLLKKSTKSAEAVATLDEIYRCIEQLIQGSRVLSYDICPPVLYVLGLEEAVTWLADEMKKKHELNVDVYNDGQFRPLSDIKRVSVFRAVKELLMNIRKHAQVSAAVVSIVREGNNIRIDITDEGVGFDDSHLELMMLNPHKYGLFSIRERIRHLGGVFEVNSERGAEPKLRW